MAELINVAGWELGRIPYRGRRIYVRYLPDCNKRIAMDRERNFYIHNSWREIWQKVSGGVFAAYRMLIDIEATYQGEIPEIGELMALARDLNIDFLGYSKDVSGREKLNLTKKIRQVIEPLLKAKNISKQEARDQFFFCLALKDSNGRVNIGVFRARSAAAFERLTDRLKGIGRIQPHIFWWQGELGELITTIEYFNHQAESFVGRAEDELVRTPPRIKIALALVKAAIKLVAKVDFKPFLFTRRLTLTELWEVHNLLEKREIEKARDILRISRESLGLRLVRSRLEKLILRISKKENFGMDKLGWRFWDVLGKEISEIKAQVSLFSEKGFKVKVCQKITEILAEAKDKCFIHSSLREIKELLKEAASFI